MKENYSDTELLYKIGRNDERAFGELFNRYWEPLYRKAMAILDNPALCKDIVQDVFYSIWVRRAELDVKSIKAYLEQATRFQVFKAIRDRRAGPKLQENIAFVTADIMADDPFLFKEHQQLLDHLINKLPEDCREVFRMSRKEELTYKEIAQRTGISERSVEHRIAKALEFFRRNYTYGAWIVLLFSSYTEKFL